MTLFASNHATSPPRHTKPDALRAIVLCIILTVCASSAICFGVDILNYNAADDTTIITIEDDPTTPGGDRIVDDAQPAPVNLFNVDFLNLLSGTGSETIVLSELDSATALAALTLSGDNDAGTDTGNDTFRITPSTRADVHIEGGAGDDQLIIEVDRYDVEGTKTSITLDGHAPITFADDVERIDLIGEDELEDRFEIMPSTTAEIHVEGFGEFDTLTVLAPEHLAVDSGTYIEMCNHERIYYSGIEQVVIENQPLDDSLIYNSGNTNAIAISDAAGMPTADQIEQAGLGTVAITDIDELIIFCHANGNLVQLLALDTCSWLISIGLAGQAGDDDFEVTPTLGAAVEVRGEDGFDTLTVDALGQAAVDWGTHIEVDGYQDITYSGIETVVLVNAAPAASIEVRGDSHVIANGDTTPSTHDFTDFGDVPVDKGVSRSFVIHSLNAVDLQLADSPPVVLAGSADFVVTLQPTELPIAQGESSRFTIRCTPSEVGTQTATVSIANGDPTQDPYEFNIQCTGTEAPEISVRGNNQEIENGDDTPSATDHTEFGYLEQTSITRTFRIRNTGTEALHLYNAPNYVTVSQGQFEVTHQPEQEIAVNGASTFAITVHPGTEDAPTAVVSIWNTDANEDPFTFTVHAGGSEEETGPWPDAGPDQIAVVGERVILDGTGSRDTRITSLASSASSLVGPKDIETYRWEFAVRSAASGQSGFLVPEGSACMTSAQGFNTSVASFIPDMEGEYVLELHVTNDLGVTMMDTVTITAFPAQEPMGDFRLDRFAVSPNPFSSWVTFGFEGDGIPDLLEVSVYTLSGHLLWAAHELDQNEIAWDGRTTDGDLLANGVYIATIHMIANGQRYSERVPIFVTR